MAAFPSVAALVPVLLASALAAPATVFGGLTFSPGLSIVLGH